MQHHPARIGQPPAGRGVQTLRHCSHGSIVLAEFDNRKTNADNQQQEYGDTAEQKIDGHHDLLPSNAASLK